MRRDAAEMGGGGGAERLRRLLVDLDHLAVRRLGRPCRRLVSLLEPAEEASAALVALPLLLAAAAAAPLLDPLLVHRAPQLAVPHDVVKLEPLLQHRQLRRHLRLAALSRAERRLWRSLGLGL